MPGSHAGEDWAASGVEPLPRVMSPVEAARLAPGAWLDGLSMGDGCGCSAAKAVFKCRASLVFTGEFALFLWREVKEDSRRPV